MSSVREVAKVNTPAGGYGEVMPPPVLEGCADPLAPGAPDLRGTWRVIDAWANDEPLPDTFPIWQHTERIEQAADRVVVTSSGVIHDMYADGTHENGVHDVMQTDFTTRIVVAASFEDGVLVLRPKDFADVEVRRWREGPHLLWQYHTAFTARLERVDTER